MNQQPNTPDEATPMRDARLLFVQQTALFLLVVGVGVSCVAAVVHWTQADAHPVSRTMPVLLAASFLALVLRQLWRPERVISTMWIGWAVALVGLAIPAWLFVVLAIRDGVRVVDTLPPIGAMFLPTVLVMALFARTRAAAWATAIAWLLIAAPVLVYLLLHPAELRSPRGVELMIALGPLSLIAPLLLPLLRGVEQRFHAMREEGERLQSLAERDVLIGLYNRRAGERFLSTLLAHSRDDVVLILFDIDHFKRINDQFGHPAGDAVLIEVGKRCSAMLGGDDIFARWGGEEFLVVLPNAPRDAGPGIAERLRAAIHAAPIANVGLVSASFGVTAVRPGDTLPEILQRADEALYRAKAEGRNRVVAS